MMAITANTLAQQAQIGDEPLTAALDNIRILLEQLNRDDIQYCHWKSNRHVVAGLIGDTDLDILVERGATLKLSKALAEAGFKRFSATAASAYAAVEDYLGMDHATGKLIHLHMHYQLVAGEPRLKGYRLPWEHLVLSTRQFDGKHKIYVVDSNMEFLLLIVRAVLKLGFRDRLLSALGGREAISKDIELEFKWLQERISQERLAEIAKQILNEEAARLVSSFATTQLSIARLTEARQSVLKSLRLFRTYNVIEARLRRALREVHWLCSAINKRYVHAAVPMRRTDPNGGHVIALLGCDGSGKSTVVREISHWLSWKIDVVPIYFGSGDGPASLIRLPMKYALKMIRKTSSLSTRTPVAQGSQAHAGQAGRSQVWWWLAKVPWALSLSLEKRRKLRKAHKARQQSLTVICDRYPQNQVMGFTDGPLLTSLSDSRSGLLRAVAEWERLPYRSAEMYPPDIVIKLMVTPEVGLARKADGTIEQYARRAEAIKMVRYASPAKCVEIDADQALEQVILEIKRHVWQEL